MKTPKIKFLGIRFLRTALNSQHSLAGVVLQNRQKIDLLVPEQGGTLNILVMGNLELANAPANPCYHHIDAAYDCSMYYQ